MDSAENDSLTRCSNACTRAGLSVLLAASLAIALIQPLLRVQALLAWVSYAELRQELSNRLQALTQAPCFQRWSEVNQSELKSLRLGEVATIECFHDVIGGGTLSLTGESKLDDARLKNFEQLNPFVKEGTQRTPRPMSNRIGTVLREQGVHLRQGYELAEVLSEILDGDAIKSAKKYAPRTRRSIDRWREQLINRLVQQGLSRGGAFDGPLSVSKEELLKFLTIPLVSEVVTLEMPDPRILEDLVAQERISLPQVSMPLELGTATVLVEFGLFLSLGYFVLFQREALGMRFFPGVATIFSVVHRSKVSKATFLLLCAIPIGASLALSLFALSPLERVINGVMFTANLLLAVLLVRDFLRCSTGGVSDDD